MATRFPIATLANDLTSFRRAFDPFFDENLIPTQIRALRTHSVRPILPLDVYANDDETVVLAAVPGVSPDQIEVSVEKNTVTLTGKIPSAAEAEDAKNATWYLRELSHGSFKRQLELPYEVDAQRAEATFEHGMLRLTLPKLESAKRRQIRIKVSSGASSNATAEPEAIEAGEATTPIAETATANAEQAPAD